MAIPLSSGATPTRESGLTDWVPRIELTRPTEHIGHSQRHGGALSADEPARVHADAGCLQFPSQRRLPGTRCIQRDIQDAVDI